MSAKSNRRGKQRGSGRRRGSIIVSCIGGGLFITLLLLYLAAALFYKSHFYGNTIINGIDMTNMTVSEAEKSINAEVETYRLTITGRNNLKDIILGSNIDLHTEFNGCIEKLLENQNPLAWPVFLLKPQKFDVDTMIDYDESLLKICYDRLTFFDEANMIKPKNASISEYGENGFEVVPEEQGAMVMKDQLYTAVVNAVNSLEPSLSIEEAACYEKPEIGSDDPQLVQAISKMNKLASAKITYQFGDTTEVLDGSKISKWITVDDQYNVSFDDSNGIKEYVDYIGKTYNTFGKARTFKTTYGDVIQVKGGDYGWWLNRPEEVKELTQLVMDGAQQVKKPVYFQTAQQYGDDDIGNTYVEINLTAQHLFFYKNGKLVLETDFVSGNVSKLLATPAGTYPIQYKENNATLVGEDYETPVKYWMPFNRNIGLHDASWRTKFGKDIYLTSGSHGCINMPPEAAEKMFKEISRGVAVVVYELPGTENYEMTDKIKAIFEKAKADAEKAAEEKAAGEKTGTDKTNTDKTNLEKTNTDKANTNKTSTDKTNTDKTGTDKTATDNSTSDNADTE